jgi:hypothetical protein
VSHDATHDALLEKALTGELERDSPELRARIAACRACRERLEELDAAAALVAEAGEGRMRRDLEEARRLASPLRATAESAMRRVAREGPRAPRRGPWLVALVLAAAAVAAVAALWRTDPPAAPLVLDAGGLELAAPLGDVEAYTAFRWSFDRPSGGFYELRVWDASAGPDAPPLLEVLELEASRWTLAEEASRALPGAIRWEVRAFDGAMTLVASAEASARRR